MKNFFLINYGCQMNVLEAEKMKGLLIAEGYEEAPDEFNSDVVIMNTCAVRETAERKIFGKIGQIRKHGRPGLLIAVCGCVTQVSGESIFEKYPGIDIVLGSGNKMNIAAYLSKAGSSARILDLGNGPERDSAECAQLAKRGSEYSAFIEIMKGCDNFCAYCIVPYARGGEVSLPPVLVLDEIKMLIDRGYKEFTLLGQNVNSYGKKFADGSERRFRFHDLLGEIEKIKGIFRLRFITSHPRDLSSETIDVMASSGIIAHSLHLPAQSGSDRILKAMNRGYTISEYLEKVERLKKDIPGFAFTTDIIFGFPGETESDYRDTLNLMERVRFKNAFLFRYSERRKTAASGISEGLVDNEEKLSRLQNAIEIQKKISLEESIGYVGATKNVLFSSLDRKGRNISGRDTHDMIVIVENNMDKLGTVRDVLIERANSFTLYGRLKSA